MNDILFAICLGYLVGFTMLLLITGSWFELIMLSSLAAVVLTGRIALELFDIEEEQEKG